MLDGYKRIGKISYGNVDHVGKILYISDKNYKRIKEKLNLFLIKDLDECLNDFIYKLNIEQEYSTFNYEHLLTRCLKNETYKVTFIYDANIKFDFVLLVDCPSESICELVDNNKEIFKSYESLKDFSKVAGDLL